MSGTLYRCLSTEGEVLYIGATMRGGDRLNQHRSSTDWWPEVGTVEVQHFATKVEALVAEAEAIRAERPKHNKRSSDPDELGRRRAEREEAAERQRERAAQHYSAAIECTNCGRGRNAHRLEIPKGTAIEDAECSDCGLKTYRLKETA